MPRTVTDSHEARVQYMSWSPDGNGLPRRQQGHLFALHNQHYRSGRKAEKNIAEYGLGIVYERALRIAARWSTPTIRPPGQGIAGHPSDFLDDPLTAPGRRLTINPRGGFRSVRVPKMARELWASWMTWTTRYGECLSMATPRPTQVQPAGYWMQDGSLSGLRSVPRAPCSSIARQQGNAISGPCRLTLPPRLDKLLSCREAT
jgi:hypothetical protein